MNVNPYAPVQAPYYPQTAYNANYAQAPQQVVSPYQTQDALKISASAKSIDLNLVYANFSPKTSRFSPFYKGEANTTQPTQPTQTVQPTETLQPTQPTQPVQPQAPLIPARQIPDGPADSNVQNELKTQVANITDPNKAVELINNYATTAIKEREYANDFTWGAKYYALKAVDIAQAQNIKNLPADQQQLVKNQIEEYRQKSVAYLNEAKKHAILTFNSCLKSTLVYNHFFTGQGSMVNTADDNARQAINAKLDEAWLRWEKGFEKDFKGQKQLAAPAATVVDNAVKEVAEYFKQLNTILQ